MKIIDWVRYYYSNNTSAKTRTFIGRIRAYIRRLSTDRAMIEHKILINAKLERNLRNIEKIKIAFFILSDSEWKFGKLYEYFEEDSRFEPIVIICPLWKVDERIMMNDVMERTYSIFKTKGYNVLKTYDKENDIWLDVKKKCAPDIIFWGFPYEKQTKEEYFITSYPDVLACYVPYFFGTVNCAWAFDLLFHNLLWILFCESSFHKEMYKQMERRRGENVYVSGYPPIDSFLPSSSVPEFQWKIKDKNFRRLIWAPHHTIEKDGYSNFLEYSQTMLDIVRKYENKIQFVFKPHPLLRTKLYELKGWGKEKTDEYYALWDGFPNAKLCDGEYIDLFLSSDGMVHDSGSFTVEYLYTLKPVYYFASENRIKDLNEFGNKAYQLHYLGYSKEDLLYFIEDVILKKQDALYLKRKMFYKNYLLPPGEQTAAKNIYDKIKSYL